MTDRVDLRNALADDHEAVYARLAAQYAAGGLTRAQFARQFKDALRDHLVEAATVGRGEELTDEDLEQLAALIAVQHLFADRMLAEIDEAVADGIQRIQKAGTDA